MDLAIKAALDLIRQNAAGDRPSAASRIYADLRQRILSLDLPPGKSLLRSEIAERYGVSQTPLRDALQRLEQDDLVEIFPQSRTVVTRIDVAKVQEAHFLRVALETEVMRHLARRGMPETVAHARSVLELQRELAGDSESLQQFQELDEYFHGVLFAGLGHDNLHGLIRSRAGHLDRVRRLQAHSARKIATILDGHKAILDAIEARDEAAAMGALRDHLRKAPDWIEEFRAGHAAFFV